MAKKIGIYMPDDIAARLPAASSQSGSIARACDRYAEIIAATPLPTFERSEWALIMEACLGTLWEPAANIRYLWQGVEDALADGLAEKWGVDGAALIERLKQLPFAEELRIVHELEGGFRP